MTAGEMTGKGKIDFGNGQVYDGDVVAGVAGE
jgi:hypothetical protein